MKNIKRYIRKNSTLSEVIIMLLGIVLVTCSRDSTILTGIGASVIASAIVVFMTDVFIGNEENENVKRWGLEQVYCTRCGMNSSCDEYLLKAKRIDIIAFGLKSFRDTQQKQIERILDSGGNIRIITMKPQCANLKARERDELEAENSISHSIEQLIAWAMAENKKNHKGKIEIRCHDHLPLDFLFLMDNRMFAGPYVYGKSSQQTISFEYNNSGQAYEHYKNYFNELWNNKEFCVDA